MFCGKMESFHVSLAPSLFSWQHIDGPDSTRDTTIKVIEGYSICKPHPVVDKNAITLVGILYRGKDYSY
jgi:hypothetical protein